MSEREIDGMRTANLTQARLRELIERFPSCRIAVLGDFFLDKYLDVDPALEELASRPQSRPIRWSRFD